MLMDYIRLISTDRVYKSSVQYVCIYNHHILALATKILRLDESLRKQCSDAILSTSAGPLRMITSILQVFYYERMPQREWRLAISSSASPHGCVPTGATIYDVPSTVRCHRSAKYALIWVSSVTCWINSYLMKCKRAGDQSVSPFEITGRVPLNVFRFNQLQPQLYVVNCTWRPL